MLRYKKHVCRQEYEDLDGWERRQKQTEEEWPEYKKSTKLVSSFKSLLRISDSRLWCESYLKDYVQPLQELKQNHVHALNANGERVPLTHCRRNDDPTKCKGDFPRTKWIIADAVVLCPGLAVKMGMASGGRRNRIGSLQGPQNEEYLNGTHPAMSVALPYNSDVQLPYRLPICQGTHASKHCKEDCINSVNNEELLEATQNAQDAQAGYACDYQNKRAARSCNEVKEAIKGHRTLRATLVDKPVSLIGKRHVTRLCSDAYGKGIVRSLQESTNLRVYSKDTDVLAAETFRTAYTVAFPGGELTHWREAIFERVDYVPILARINVDRSHLHKGRAFIQAMIFLYGHRPNTSPCWFLSVYEYMMYWTIKPVRYPTTLESNEEKENDLHALLTDLGRRRIADAKQTREIPDLVAGKDYKIKNIPPPNADWYPFADTLFTADYRHSWVLVRRKRPMDPTFLHCPMPRRGEGERERNAALIMTYFRPFTLNPQWHTEDVPFLGQMCGQSDSWHASMLYWFDGHILSEESKRYIQNFLVVTRVRPEEEDMDHSDDLLSDDELILDNSSFEEAISTRVGSRRTLTDNRSKQYADGDESLLVPAEKVTPDDNSGDAFQKAATYWPVPKMITHPTKRAGEEISADMLVKIKQAVTASQKQTEPIHHSVQYSRTESCRIGRDYSTDDVHRFIEETRKRKKKDGTQYFKSAQLQVLTKVGERVCKELEETAREEDLSRPLLWLVHGGPGVGKSETIKLIQKLFVDVLHWNIGIDFQIAALQAVMAEQLGGDTLHHCCGIGTGGLKNESTNGQGTKRQSEVAKAVLQWRWLIIDEISMISSQLLAEVDMCLRNIIRNLGTWRLSHHGDVRPFGGINVLFRGRLLAARSAQRRRPSQHSSRIHPSCTQIRSQARCSARRADFLGLRRACSTRHNGVDGVYANGRQMVI